MLKSCGGRNGSREEEMNGWDRESNIKRWATTGGRVCHGLPHPGSQSSLNNLPIHCDPCGNRWSQWRWQKLRLQRQAGLNPQSVLTNSQPEEVPSPLLVTPPHQPTPYGVLGRRQDMPPTEGHRHLVSLSSIPLKGNQNPEGNIVPSSSGPRLTVKSTPRTMV